jgi:hypothetical protein
MTDTATIVTIIAATGLIITVIKGQGRATDQRLDDVGKRFDERFNGVYERFKGIDQRFTDLEKVFDANFETVRVEIRQLKEQVAKAPLVLP